MHSLTRFILLLLVFSKVESLKRFENRVSKRIQDIFEQVGSSQIYTGSKLGKRERYLKKSSKSQGEGKGKGKGKGRRSSSSSRSYSSKKSKSSKSSKSRYSGSSSRSYRSRPHRISSTSEYRYFARTLVLVGLDTNSLCLLQCPYVNQAKMVR